VSDLDQIPVQEGANLPDGETTAARRSELRS
jgi:hypothetical protein